VSAQPLNYLELMGLPFRLAETETMGCTLINIWWYM